MDNLIAQLCDDLKPMHRLASPARRMFVWFAGVLVYLAVTMTIIHFRDDVMAVMSQPVMMFEFILVGMMALVSGYAAFCLCAPDGYGRRWPIGGAFLLLGAFCVFLVSSVMLSSEDTAHFHFAWHECVAKSVVYFVLPVVALTYYASKGATTRPKMLLGMGALCISSLGYLALRATCFDDTALHTVTYHVLPYIFIGIVSGLLAQRFLRW